MAKTIGTLTLRDGGLQTGFVGNLPVEEAVAAVKEGRLRLEPFAEPRRAYDIEDLLAGLEVGSISELARLVAVAREVESRDV